MRKELANVERRIAVIAKNQHGVITTEQLVGAGLSLAGITRRVKASRLHRLYRGVYAVGHTNLSEKGRLMAPPYLHAAPAPRSPMSPPPTSGPSPLSALP